MMKFCPDIGIKMGSQKDKLITHCENCDSCIALEELREKLHNYVKLRIADVFACIDVAQIECCNNADL